MFAQNDVFHASDHKLSPTVDGLDTYYHCSCEQYSIVVPNDNKPERDREARGAWVQFHLIPVIRQVARQN